MNKTLAAIALLTAFSAGAQNDTVRVWKTQVPLLIERTDNPVYYLKIDAQTGDKMNEITMEWSDTKALPYVESLKLYYGGTRRTASIGKNVMKPLEYLSSTTKGETLSAVPGYSLLKAEERNGKKEVTFRLDQDLTEGTHFYWVSLEMKPTTPLGTTLHLNCTSATVNGQNAVLHYVSGKGVTQRTAVGVRKAGDDNVAAYRIPGIVTTDRGTLLATYDVRYNNSADLQEHIDVGLSRSTDGGKTWEKMRIPLAFGNYGGLPAAQNGVGDPCILFDPTTRTTWIAAAWTHGMAGQRAWNASKPGMDIEQTAQLVLTKSTDDGKTWSEPINITSQVKQPEWHFLLQGPGRGITMENGTLVFPIQFIGKDRIPCAGIMYSTDKGETWTIHRPARTNTTEAQVAEIEPGVLMLNMRDNRGGSRAVSTTTNLGKTWVQHSSSRNALQEPVCMASLLHVKADDNALKRDILLFSNPNTTAKRHHITIKASLDRGKTWHESNQLLLDEAIGWGYSCLTMIDRKTVGILYESSSANITFQTIPLKDIVKELK